MSLPRCEADGVSEYWGGCHAPSRYRIERSSGTGYSPAEACPAHVADILASMADGEDVSLIVRVHFDPACSAAKGSSGVIPSEPERDGGSP